MQMLLKSLVIFALAAATDWAVQPVFRPAAGHNPPAPPYQPPPGVRVKRDIEYVPGGGPAQSLDLYFPEQPGKTPLPLLVWIHGGGWMRGDKNPSVAIHFVERGYVLASVDYRVSTDAVFPAQIQDCQAAIRFLRSNAAKYGVDPEHIGVWGNSAGAHLCNLLGVAGGQNAFPPVGDYLDQSDRVQAVCAFCGPTDLHTIRTQAEMHSDVKTVISFNTAKDPYSNLIGVPLGQDVEKELAASPVHYVRQSPGNLSFLLVHGTADQYVPFAQAEEFADVLRKNEVNVILQRLPGADHPSKAFYMPPVQQLVESFFDQTLKGATVKVEPLPDEAITLPKALATSKPANR
jgi:acetyl esterase/lipase